MPECNPATSQFGRLLVICPEAIRVQCGVDITDMEEFGGRSFLRFFPRNYTPVFENKLEFMGTTNYPKVGMSRYGFNCKIEDERGELYYALQQIIWNSLSTTHRPGAAWRPVTVVDFANPGIPGRESGVDSLGYRYAVRHGMIKFPSDGNFEQRGFVKDGYSFEFMSHDVSMRPNQ